MLHIEGEFGKARGRKLLLDVVTQPVVGIVGNEHQDQILEPRIVPAHEHALRCVGRVMDERFKGLHFHFLVVDRKSYEAWIRDPFMLADKVAPTWDAQGTLPTLTHPTEDFKPRTLGQVQAVLKTCYALNVPVVARGAGTGLSGGAMPHKLG